MTRLGKETWKVIKLNLGSILLVEFLYRLVTSALFLKLLSLGVNFSLKRTGYSFLTVGNFLPFLANPWTIGVILGLLIVGSILLCLEISMLVCGFQASQRLLKLTPARLFWDGLMGMKEILYRRDKWPCALLALNMSVLMNLNLIYRTLTHVKPLNFIISTAWENPAFRVLIVAVVILVLAVGLWYLFAFHGVLLEQKNFSDSAARSRELLKGYWIQALAALVVLNLALAVLFYVAYSLFAVLTAVVVLIFTERKLALALMLASCDKLDLILIFITSLVGALANYSLLGILYSRRRARHQNRELPAFELPVTERRHKKAALGILLASLVICAFFVYDVVYNGSLAADMALSEVQITAHRGSSKEAPENTLEALMAAAEELADFAEIDVQLTKDGAIVLMHDANTKRTTGVSGSIGQMTLEQVQALDAGSWFSKEFAGTRIPTLEQVLDYCKGRLNLNIEVKNVGKNSELPQKVVEMVKEYDFEEQCVLTSTSLGYLRQIKELAPELKTGYILSAAYGNYFEDEAVDFISIRSNFINESMIEAAHGAGKAVHGWTVNSKSEMERMRILGVDNVITDKPLLAREVIYREEATESLLEYISMVLK